MRPPTFCLLFTLLPFSLAFADAEPIPTPSLKQQIVKYLQALRAPQASITQAPITPANYWADTTPPYLQLGPEAYREHFPLLGDDGLPLGTTALNYRMQLDSRLLGIEVRFEF